LLLLLSRGKKRKEKGKSYRGITGVKLGIKEKRQEKEKKEDAWKEKYCNFLELLFYV
jgi:hypothetical protein